MVALAHQIHPPGFIRAFPRGPSLNSCKECLEQLSAQSPSRSQVSRHDEWEWGWSGYSGALWAEMLYRQDDRQSRADNQEQRVHTRDKTEVLTHMPVSLTMQILKSRKNS